MDDEPLQHIQKEFLARVDSLERKYSANGKLPYWLNAILKTHFNDMEAILEKRTNSLEDLLILKIMRLFSGRMYEKKMPNTHKSVAI